MADNYSPDESAKFLWSASKKDRGAVGDVVAVTYYGMGMVRAKLLNTTQVQEGVVWLVENGWLFHREDNQLILTEEGAKHP